MSQVSDRTSVMTTAEIRSHFPALERRQDGALVAYFDGPGGTQVPRSVVAAMTDYLFHHNANTHWAFPTSQETDQAIAAARAAFADLFNAAPDEVAFGANMTSLTLHLGRALGRAFAPGDEVVVTELDHHANVDPWREMARDRGLTIRLAKMIPGTGQLDREDLERQLSGKTRLLAVGAASNALGTINDIAWCARLAHQNGALLFVDAVHHAPHALIDVRALDCDFLACSAYKFYGPHVGVLYGRHALLQSLDVPRLRPASDAAPDRLETGTQSHEAIVGAAAAVDFLASLAPGASRRGQLQAAYAALHERGRVLVERLWSGLSALDRLTLHGPPPGAPRTPTIAFTIDGLAPEQVCRALARQAIFASHGDFYASTAVARLGVVPAALVRLGCACYTTEDEVDRLLEAVSILARG